MIIIIIIIIMMSLTRTYLTAHFQASTVEPVCLVKTLVFATEIRSFEHDFFKHNIPLTGIHLSLDINI